MKNTPEDIIALLSSLGISLFFGNTEQKTSESIGLRSEDPTTVRLANATQDPFTDVRKVVLSLATEWDNGNRAVLYNDKDRTTAIIIRLLKVLFFDAEAGEPIFLVSYEGMSGTDVLGNPDTGSQQYTYTFPALMLLWEVLEQNRRHVERMKPNLPADLCDTGHISFFLPLNPLNMRDIGSLTNASNICAICKKKANMRCCRCQSVTYCSRGCQTKDWNAHEDICKSLSAGTWQTIRCTDTFQGMYVSSMQPTSTATDLRKNKPKVIGSGLKNVHGDKPFIVKIQMAGFDGPSMLIYDRQRSFQATYLRSEDPLGFQRLADIMQRTIMGLKMYRWAKFVDNWKLNVCIDTEPKEDVQW